MMNAADSNKVIANESQLHSPPDDDVVIVDKAAVDKAMGVVKDANDALENAHAAVVKVVLNDGSIVEKAKDAIEKAKEAVEKASDAIVETNDAVYAENAKDALDEATDALKNASRMIIENTINYANDALEKAVEVAGKIIEAANVAFEAIVDETQPPSPHPRDDDDDDDDVVIVDEAIKKADEVSEEDACSKTPLPAAADAKIVVDSVEHKMVLTETAFKAIREDAVSAIKKSKRRIVDDDAADNVAAASKARTVMSLIVSWEEDV